jgi:mono/diheme cytochrome c family protein
MDLSGDGGVKTRCLLLKCIGVPDCVVVGSAGNLTNKIGYRMLEPETKRFQTRLPDAALYAMALYIYSLQSPANPNRFDERAAAGEKVFQREGCVSCHTPPLYTNNKLTLAKGFGPPKDKSATLDVMPVSVGTDPGLALNTRRGTGDTTKCLH